jgi:hypothetical protein
VLAAGTTPKRRGSASYTYWLKRRGSAQGATVTSTERNIKLRESQTLSRILSEQVVATVVGFEWSWFLARTSTASRESNRARYQIQWKPTTVFSMNLR